jgi:hypothetical protein
MVAGLLLQVVLFSEPVSAVVGAMGPLLYVGSTLLVVAAVLRNIRIPGMALVALGAASNLAAIAANGGYMPASADALASLHRTVGAGYSNSTAAADPALPWLTDIFAMPSWMPWANVFSVGDVLLSLGVAATIILAMHRTATVPVHPGTDPSVPPTPTFG